MEKKFIAKDFQYLIGSLDGLSSELIEQHLKLYDGYINSSNELLEKLYSTEDKTGNPSFSNLRNFVSSKAFPYNGIVLHELYFENLTAQHQEATEELKEHISKHFETFENFIECLKATAMSARSGWAICAYNKRNCTIENFAIDLHDEHVPNGIEPILIIDVWEHAYTLDFGTNKKDYLNTICKNINWEIVSKRLLEAKNRTK